MIFGPITPGGSFSALSMDFLRLNEVVLPEGERLVGVYVWLDGGGSSSGTQAMRGVVYDAASKALLAEGDEVSVPDDLEGGWVALPFPYGSHPELPTEVLYGVHSGPTANVVRFQFGASTITRYNRADTYSDGAPNPLAGEAATADSAYSIYLLTTTVWTGPDTADEHIAALPFGESQRIFAIGGPVAGSARLVTCGWHGTKTDPNIGAYGIARADGPLADYVGERVRVRDSESQRVVYVYIVDEADVIEDLSLTRRAFMELGLASTEELSAVVEVMG